MSRPHDTGTMLAVRIHRYGGAASDIRLDRVPVPQPAPGEVLVRVHAAGVNPVDRKLREGLLGDVAALPLTLGYDLAGTVVARGAGVIGWQVDARVFGMRATVSPGAFAEFAAVPAGWLAAIPAELDFARAAALPMGALTAWLAVVDRGVLRRGQRVLVHGGAGAVGIAAVQIAKQLGAWVAATASAADADRLRHLGVDQVIDYRHGVFDRLLSDLDLVIDTQGGEVQQRSWAVLRQGGRMVSTLGTPDIRTESARGKIAAPGFGAVPDGARLTTLASLAAKNALVIPVAHRLPLAEAARALESTDHAVARGKIVLVGP